MQEPKQKKGLRSKKDQPAESLYDVEAVKGKETRDGIKCYLIKWSGYDEETWEPVDAIKHLKIAKDYEKEHVKFAKMVARKKPQKQDTDQRHDPSHTVYHFVQGLSHKEKETLKRCEQPHMSRINTGVAAKKIVGMEKTTDHGEEKPTLYYVHFADDSHEKVPGALLQRLESKMLFEFLDEQFCKAKIDEC